MTSKFIEREITYDGTQLTSHFAYRTAGIEGDSIVAFAGPVKVNLSEMVDLEDVRNNEPIASDRMLNFIVEVFGLSLEGTVWMQRLLMAVIQDELNSLLGELAVFRSGDDLYYDDRKLSVSIATASPVSTLIHSALNIEETGAPIRVSCLREMNVDDKELAYSILNRFSQEFEDVRHARVKVNWVR